jgi:AraC family transcriptional regulator, melibiose operon regulatory protein
LGLKLVSNKKKEDLGLYSSLTEVKAMTQYHAHFEIEINYVIEGYMRYFMGRGEVVIPERRMCAFWAATPHRLIESAPGTKCAVFAVPLQWLVQWDLPSEIEKALLDGEVVMEPAPLTRPEKPDQWARDYFSEEDHLRKATFLEIQAALMRCVPMNTTKKSANRNIMEIEPVLAMCKFVNTNLKNNLSSAEVAGTLKPAFAMRAFKKVTGMTIQEYVVQQRLSVAQRLLLTTEMSVEEIGVESGFQSSSQYYSTFKKSTTYSPLQFRKSKQGTKR